MKSFVLILNGSKPLTIVKKNLYVNVVIVSIYINVEPLSNVDKINTLTSKKKTVTPCSKIMMFHQSCEFNPFYKNPEIEIQTDGA